MTRVREVLAWLEAEGSAKGRAELARYGLPSDGAYGIGVGVLKRKAKELGRDHALALALWASGRYEARMLATFVDDPAALTVAQLNAWAADFDSWGICDTACFHLFDRTPLAWARIKPWARASATYHRRAAFALLWALTVHDRTATDAQFLACLPLVAKAATDERDHVKKGVDMALRAVGKRNPKLRVAARDLAAELAASDDATAAWIGRHAGRELR